MRDRFLTLILVATLVLSLSSLGVGGCNSVDALKKNKGTTSTSSNKAPDIDIAIQGPNNFGGVLLGDHIDTVLLVTNKTANSASLSDVYLPYPFSSMDATPTGCAPGYIPANTQCKFTIRFAPTSRGDYTAYYRYNGKGIEFSGTGLLQGTYEVTPSFWNINTVVAGSGNSLNLRLKNKGDVAAGFPTISLPPGGSIGAKSCDTTVAPGAECVVTIYYSRTTSGYFNDYINISANGESSQVQVYGTILADKASGSVGFNIGVPFFRIGNSYNVSTEPVKDKYGNVIRDGVIAYIAAFGCDVLGGISTVTYGGVASFSIQASTLGACILSVTVDDSAFGTTSVIVSP